MKSKLAVAAACVVTATVALLIGAFISSFLAFVLGPIIAGFAVLQYFRARRRQKQSAGLWSLLLGNALVLLFLLSLGFLGFETYYRFLCDQTDAMADTLVSSAWYRRHYHRNNIGVRDNVDYAYARTPGKRRITFVGDSFVAGLGVKDVAERFANRIRHLHPEWEVHAVAQPGLETSNEVEAIHNLVVSNKYQLDLVVLVYNMNDIGEVMPGWIAEYKKLLADPFRNSWLCRNSYFINLCYQRWQIRRAAYFKNYFNELEAAYQGPLFEKHKAALNAMCNMTALRGGRLVVVTFPFMHDPSRFKAAHERMSQFWKERGVPHLDLLPVFSNLPPASITVNARDAHPNPHAHALAAEAMDGFLREALKN